jgi:hypothetical protein
MKTPITWLKTKARKFLTPLLCAAGMFGFASNVFGTLIAYEGFDYTVGSQSVGGAGLITDWNGGIGWADAWEDYLTVVAPSTEFAVSDIQAGSLNYTDMFGNMLVTAGHKLHNSGTNGNSRPARNLTTHVITNGTTTWISFLGQRTGQSNEISGLYERGANLSLFNTNVWTLPGNNAGRVGIGESSNAQPPQTNDTWGISPLGQGSQRRQSSYPFTNQALVVLRIDHHDDNDPNTISNALDHDDFYIFLNPTNLAAEPPISFAFTNFLAAGSNGTLSGIDFAFNRIVMFAGTSAGTGGSFQPPAEWLFDELRIGTTYADVVPFIPPVLPRWTAITPSGGGVSLTLTGAPNTQLTVQMATSLSPPNWSSVGTINLNGSGVGAFNDPGLVSTNQQRYYRAGP